MFSLFMISEQEHSARIMILINISPRAVKGEKAKRTVGTHPVILLVWFVCLIGLSVLATHLIMGVEYQRQKDNNDREILTVRKDYKALADRNIELQNSLQKLEDEYTRLEAQYKDLTSRFDSVEQKNIQTTSELAVASKDLETARADALRLTGELDAKLSEIEALNANREALEQKYVGFREMLDPDLILEPTWVGAGETTSAFDGNLLVVLYGATNASKCYKDSTAVGYLISGVEKKKLCLRTGKPESFKYRGKKYLLSLIESSGSDEARHYCISILKER
jgi:hypothetical protein